MAETLDGFPLFPLGLVMLPHEHVPLHIFEKRYRRMVEKCLAEETDFGILWLSDDGLRDVGCTARITRVLERFDDGRLNILTEGSTPFRLLRRIEDLPYPAGEIELLADAPDSDSAATDEARERYADLVEQLTDTRPAPEDLGALDSYAMVATLEVELEAKQALLETRSEQRRIEQLERLFASALERVRLAQQAAERARGNGSMRGG